MKTWAWVAVGLIMGLVGGLVYTWVLSPPVYYDTQPYTLQETHRHDWIAVTTLAYGAEGDWNRTQLRLKGFSKAEIRHVVAQVLDAGIAAGRPILLLQRLAYMADYYAVNSPAVAIYLKSETAPPPSNTPLPATHTSAPTASPPTPTLSPTPQPTTTPTPSPTPQFVSPYVVFSQTLTCEPTPSIAISVFMSRTVTERHKTRIAWEAQPGRDIWLLWEGGADRAVTGFRPALGLGYADFAITSDYVYKIYIDLPEGRPLSTIQVEPCTPEEGGGWLSRYLVVLESEPVAEEAMPTTTP